MASRSACAPPTAAMTSNTDKAIFSTSSGTWLANANGTGDWVALRGGTGPYCQWARRTALCSIGHQDPLSTYSNDILAVTDDGKQVRTVARNAIRWAASGPSLFYIPSSGGLYVVDGLPEPMP